MSAYEWSSLIVSVLSLLVAIYAARSSSNAKAKSEEADRVSSKANKSAEASVEIAIQSAITSTKEKIMDCSESMEELLAKQNLTDSEKRLLDLKKKRFNVALENNLNAYEDACAKYIDGKVDKVRFRKSYSTEIRNIVEDKNFEKYFDAVKSRYKAILKVYKEWNDLEK
jgi:hypothetical protein